MSNVLLTDAFTYIFNMSITACYVIIAVILIRFLICKMPKKYSYLLWSVVGFRLAVPISFKSVVSIFSLGIFDMSGVYNEYTDTLDYMDHINGSLSRLPSVDVGITGTEDAIYQGIMNLETQSRPPLVMTFQDVFSKIWLAVMIVLLLYGLGSYIFLRIRMSNAILKKGNIYESDQVSSPFILGIISPKIYIPFGLDEQTYKYVIAHEKCHLARYDYYVKLFAYILLAMHWFNPLCWLAFSLMTRDMEMSCDEKVLADNADIKKAYSNALLSFAVESKMYSVTPLCFSENNVKKRIVNVLKFKKPKLVISVAATLLCCAVILGCAANPKNVVEIEKYIPSGTTSLFSKGSISDENAARLAGRKNSISNNSKQSIKNLGTFETFYCRGDYYSYNMFIDGDSYIINEKGNRFALVANENSEDIIYTYGDKSAVVYEGDKTLRYLLTYIDNALYFMEYDCIYRIEFEYNSDGSISGQHLSFVCNKPYSIVKAETNKLILCSYNYDKKYEYFEFDTLSGKMNKIDYNYTVDANDYNFRISADDAYDIAYNEIQNDKYSSDMNNMFYNYVIRVDHSEITLICKPDLNNQHYLYERYPEYVWKVVLVDLKSSTHSVEVYVNAQTGTVCSVSTYYYD